MWMLSYTYNTFYSSPAVSHLKHLQMEAIRRILNMIVFLVEKHDLGYSVKVFS